jgi:hypothetical protein
VGEGGGGEEEGPKRVPEVPSETTQSPIIGCISSSFKIRIEWERGRVREREGRKKSEREERELWKT